MEFQVIRGHRPSRPYFWRLVDDRGHVVTESSRPFTTKAACLRAIAAVIEGCSTATVADLADQPVGRGVGFGSPVGR